MARDINRVTLLGNLTHDPQTKYSESGHGLCFFDMGISNNAQSSDKRFSYYFRVIVTGKYLDVCQQKLHKGMRVLVEGKLINYEREKTGISYRSTEIAAYTVNVIGPMEDLADLAEENPETGL